MVGIRPVADFETQKYQIMNDLNTSTEAQITDETAIGFIPCYRLPFLSLFHADCMEIMKQYPDKYFDLAIVYPPYAVGDTFRFGSSGAVKGKLNRIHKPIEWDKAVPPIEYFTELKRVSKNQIIWGANYFNCFNDSGGALVWYKNRGGNTMSQCEIASVSGQKKVDYVKIQILTGFCSNEQRIHPTQKPELLYKFIIDEYIKCSECGGSGEVPSLTIDCDVQTCKKCKGNEFKILDTHFGSGSIALAVDKANRLDKMNLHLTACEIDKEYIDKAIKRISESIEQGTLSF
jgi:site-specific DNA-methyltransferase (adenine-specific)